MTDHHVSPATPLRLTPREREVLELLASGLRQDEVAAELGIGLETVRTHLRNASERLGGATTTQTVAIAIRRDLIRVLASRRRAARSED